MIVVLVLVGLAYLSSSFLIAYECRRAPLIEPDASATPLPQCQRAKERCSCLRCRRRERRAQRGLTRPIARAARRRTIRVTVKPMLSRSR